MQALLDESTIDSVMNEHYKFDFGVWMPLRLIRPEGDVPVVQLSLPMYEDPRQIMKLGHTLSILREKGILLLASGNAAINMSKIIWHARGEDIHPKIKEFDSWLRENLMTANVEKILNYRQEAPHSDFAHPSTASLLPLFFTMGTSISGDFPQIIYHAFKYSTVSLLNFSLHDKKIEQGTFS